MLLGRADFVSAAALTLAVTMDVPAMGAPAFDTRCLDEVAIPGAYMNPCQKDRLRQLDFPAVGRLSIEQGAVGPGTTGAAVWNAGTALAGFLASNGDLLAGKSVIELGCGTGLCGIVAARQGASRVLLTDGNRDLLPRVERNVAANLPAAVARNVGVRTLQWGELVDGELLGTFDIVLGSDVLYNSAAWRPFAACAKDLLRPRSGTIVLAESGHENMRVEPTVGGFRVVAEGCGLVVDDPEELGYGDTVLVRARSR